jgi:hypothetical protein
VAVEYRDSLSPPKSFGTFLSAAVKQADGSFDVNRINVGRDGASPP